MLGQLRLHLLLELGEQTGHFLKRALGKGHHDRVALIQRNFKFDLVHTISFASGCDVFVKLRVCHYGLLAPYMLDSEMVPLVGTPVFFVVVLDTW